MVRVITCPRTVIGARSRNLIYQRRSGFGLNYVALILAYEMQQDYEF
jgi:hypothetical protein